MKFIRAEDPPGRWPAFLEQGLKWILRLVYDSTLDRGSFHQSGELLWKCDNQQSIGVDNQLQLVTCFIQASCDYAMKIPAKLNFISPSFQSWAWSNN